MQAKIQKFRVVVIFFTLNFFVLVSLSYAQDAAVMGKTIGTQFLNVYGSKSGIKQRIIQPTMSNTPMETLNHGTSFNAQIECPNSKSFLQILFQPTSTNDFKAVISQDPHLTGHFTYQATTPLISGVCNNGFISCNQGTWQNCRFYQWALSDDKIKWVQVADDTPLGTCFCVNNSCGGNVFQQFSQITNTFGAGLAGFIATQQNFAISNVQAAFPLLSYYGQDAKSCSITTGNYSGTAYNNPSQYYKNSEAINNGVSQAVNGQSNNVNSPYYSVMNSEYLKNNPVTQKQCSIKRKVYLSDLSWVTDGGMKTTISCQGLTKIGNNLYQCTVMPISSNNGYCGCGESWSVYVDGKWVFHAYSPDDFNAIVKNVTTGQTLVSSGSCSTTGGTDPVTRTYQGTANGLISAGVGNAGACNGRASGTFYVFLKRYEKINEQKTDTCSNLDTTNCRLETEQVCDYNGNHCVYTVQSYNKTGVHLTSSCHTVTDGPTGLQWSACVNGSSLGYTTNAGGSSVGSLETGNDIWWTVKRVYTCKAPKMTLPSLEREKNIEQSGAYNNGIASYPDVTTNFSGIGGYSGTYQAQYQYSGAQENCQYSCIVQVATARTNAIAAGSETTNAPPSTPQDNSFSKTYLACKKDVNGMWYCPATGNQQVVQQCVCLDQGAQSIATMSAVISAAKDLTCSTK